eukprot:COSAG01_NODE_1564_length_9896_cov_4.868837_14_plen_133_part_00
MWRCDATNVVSSDIVRQGVFAGTAWPSCLDNTDCTTGSYCPDTVSTCSRCLEQDLTPKFTTDTNATRFCAMIADSHVFMANQADGVSACSSCRDENLGDGWNLGKSYTTAIQHNAKLMRADFRLFTVGCLIV